MIFNRKHLTITPPLLFTRSWLGDLWWRAHSEKWSICGVQSNELYQDEEENCPDWNTTAKQSRWMWEFLLKLTVLCIFSLSKIVFLLLLSDHCMVNFIKENLLGSLKEFRNRFINPIQNGQCADSTAQDVRLMKKRAHILYEMLAGCVQVMFQCLQGLFICPLWPPYCFLQSTLFFPTEKRLHRTHQILAPQTRICVVYQSIPVTV